MHLADISAWNKATLTITAPAGFTGTFSLTVAATATETATGETATYALNLPVTVVQRFAVSPPATRPVEHERDEEHDDKRGCDAVKTTDYTDGKGHFNLINNGETKGSGWTEGKDGYHAIDNDKQDKDGTFYGQGGSASIVLSSVHAEVKPVLGFPINAAVPDDGKEKIKPVTDWSKPVSTIFGNDEDDNKKPRQAKPALRSGSGQAWLTGFLGAEKEVKQDAASLSKLSVTLKGKEQGDDEICGG